MPFTDWDSYADLLDKLAAEPRWGGATSFDQFDQIIRSHCPELLDDYGELCDRLIETGDYADRNLILEHIRAMTLPKPTVTPTPTPQAAPTTPDLRENHFDPEKNRWRRWNETDNEFEHFHNEDNVWERERGGLWHRFHDAAKQWLPYDGPSRTWLHDNTWVAYDEVTATKAEVRADERAGEDLDALAARLVAETLAEQDDIEPPSAEELAETIAIVRRELAEEKQQ